MGSLWSNLSPCKKKRLGVTTQLQELHAPHVIGMHCMAHHTSLAIRYLSGLEPVQHIESLLQYLHSFSPSPLSIILSSQGCRSSCKPKGWKSCGKWRQGGSQCWVLSNMYYLSNAPWLSRCTLTCMLRLTIRRSLTLKTCFLLHALFLS